MSVYESTKYFTTKERLRETLSQYGVAIIPSVLDETECNKLVSGIWDYFEHISQSWETPIQRENQASWRELYKLFPLHSMLFQHLSVGHAHIAWNLRQNPKILDIFSTLWNCPASDLVVSYDGLSFQLPPEITNRGWNKNNTWFHTDQRYSRPDFEVVQSWVTGLDVNEGDGTLAFLEGSHRFHKDFPCEATRKNVDWYKLTPEEVNWYTSRGCLPKKIKCPKGSLVFWDSRTIHHGAEAMKGREHPNLRAIVYLCYTPRALCSPSNLVKRIKAFEELRTTNHYPHRPKLFSKVPQTYGNTLPEITSLEVPQLTPIGRRLVGYSE